MDSYLAKAQEKVNDLKNKALGLTPLQVKVNDATSDEAWGPHGQVVQELAQASYNSSDRKVILPMLFQKLRCEGKHWRQCYKSLLVLEQLCTKGPAKIAASVKEHALYIIGDIAQSYSHVDEKGVDQGLNVRERAKKLKALVTDFETLEEERERASNMRQNMDGGGVGSDIGASKPIAKASARDVGGYRAGGGSLGGNFDRRKEKKAREEALENEEKSFAEKLRQQQQQAPAPTISPPPSAGARKPVVGMSVKAPPTKEMLAQHVVPAAPAAAVEVCFCGKKEKEEEENG